MRLLVACFCALLAGVVSLTAQIQPVTTLSNAELFSRQYVQADTVSSNIGNSQIKKEISLSRKNKLNSVCMVKTTISGTAYGAIGLLVGSGIGSMAFGSGEWADLGGVVFGGIPGAIIGVSSGTYFSGRKYRKGKYMNAFVGTILPALTVAGVTALLSDKNKYNMDATLITFALSPITSTATYYIFSDELPDTVK